MPGKKLYSKQGVLFKINDNRLGIERMNPTIANRAFRFYIRKTNRMCKEDIVTIRGNIPVLNSIFEKEIEMAICATIAGICFACNTTSIEYPEISRIQVFGGSTKNRSIHDKFFSIVIACSEKEMSEDKTIFEDIRYFSSMCLSLYDFYYLTLNLFETHRAKSAWDYEHIESGPCADYKDDDSIIIFIDKIKSYITKLESFLYHTEESNTESSPKKSSKKKIESFMKGIKSSSSEDAKENFEEQLKENE